MATKWSQTMTVSRKLFITIKIMKNICLSQMLYVRYIFALYVDIQQHHLWECGGHETDDNKEWVEEEEVGGGVEVGVSACGHDNVP
jgi:hypothetical protein